MRTRHPIIFLLILRSASSIVRSVMTIIAGGRFATGYDGNT